MSYEKAMKRMKGHRHDKDYQPMPQPFTGGDTVKSVAYLAEQEMSKGCRCYVEVDKPDGETERLPVLFNNEDEAVDYIRLHYIERDFRGRICTESGLCLSRW